MPVVRFAWTARADGDLSGDLDHVPDRLGARWRGLPASWTWLHQVHGGDLVVVQAPGEHAGAKADAAVTATLGCALAVRTADCAPVVLAGERSVAVLHLGWRSLLADLVARAGDAMADLGDAPQEAHLGPCIRPGCYEFDGPELDELSDRFGAGVRSTTGWGTPALDLPAAVRAALAEQGVDDLVDEAPCTACDDRWFSHRARRETGRFATVAWLEAST